MFLGSLALRRFALDKFRPCPRDRAIAYLWPLLAGMLLIGVAMQLGGQTELVTAQTPPVASYGSAVPTGGVLLTVTLESDVSYPFVRWDVWTSARGWQENASTETYPNTGFQQRQRGAIHCRWSVEFTDPGLLSQF